MGLGSALGAQELDPNKTAVIAPPPDMPRETKKYSLNLWGGYNIAALGASSQSAVDNAEAIGGSSASRGGLAAGADFWMEYEGFELGAGFSYLSVYQYNYTQTTVVAATTVISKLHYSLNYLPLVVQGRKFLTDYFYAGVFAGYYIGIVTATSTSTYNGVAVSTDTASAGSSLGVGFMLGVAWKVEENIDVDVGIRATQLFASGIGQSITPNVGVTFHF